MIGEYYHYYQAAFVCSHGHIYALSAAHLSDLQSKKRRLQSIKIYLYVYDITVLQSCTCVPSSMKSQSV